VVDRETSYNPPVKWKATMEPTQVKTTGWDAERSGRIVLPCF
jgi:hypothetical protein